MSDHIIMKQQFKSRHINQVEIQWDLTLVYSYIHLSKWHHSKGTDL